MSSRLKARVKRLEEGAKRKNNRAPSLAEYLDVLPRVQARNLHSAFSKFDPDLPGRMLDEDELAIIENDSEEQRAKGEDVWRRSGGVHWQESSHAASAKLRLRSMKRMTVAE